MKGEGRMLNGIWMAMIVLAFVGAVCTGRWTALSAAAADGARQAVETVLLLLGAMCLWTGIMRIAGEAGLTNGLSKILSPVIKRLFPNYGKNETVREKISMNLAANMLGMGNAATPFGLSAMDEMQKLQTGDAPTQEMILFVVTCWFFTCNTWKKWCIALYFLSCEKILDIDIISMAFCSLILNWSCCLVLNKYKNIISVKLISSHWKLCCFWLSKKL